MRHLSTRRRDGGFTYLALLLVIVVMGVVMGATAEIWHTAVQREKERELLFVGNQFRNAIRSYYMDHRRYPHQPGRLAQRSAVSGATALLAQGISRPDDGRNRMGGGANGRRRYRWRA